MKYVNSVNNSNARLTSITKITNSWLRKLMNWISESNAVNNQKSLDSITSEDYVGKVLTSPLKT